jgi:hypothetical protein
MMEPIVDVVDELERDAIELVVEGVAGVWERGALGPNEKLGDDLQHDVLSVEGRDVLGVEPIH